MRIYLFISFSLLLTISFGQTNVNTKSFRYSENLNWQEIIKTAGIEHKPIFIECVATWCGICKKMEKEVISDSLISTTLYEKFISVKVIVNKEEKKNVQELLELFKRPDPYLKINAFPTFLIMASNGTPLHKDIGLKDISSFKRMLTKAFEPAEQYYTNIINYNFNKLPESAVRDLASKAKALGDTSIAKKLALSYYNAKISNVRPNQLSEKDVKFLGDFIELNDKIVKLFFLNREIFDSTVGEARFSERLIDKVIFEEVNKEIERGKLKNKEPSWFEISSKIEQQYNTDYAKRNVIGGKIAWYGYKKDSRNYCDNVTKRIALYGQDLKDGELNFYAWMILMLSDNRSILEQALLWSTRAVEMGQDISKANYMDTKANILYKLGYKNEALEIQKNAIYIAKYLNQESYVKEFSDNLNKMKENKPTWNKGQWM